MLSLEPPHWGTTTQAAAALGVSRMTIIRMIHRGELSAVRVGKRAIRVYLPSLRSEPLGPAVSTTELDFEAMRERLLAQLDPSLVDPDVLAYLDRAIEAARAKAGADA